MADHKDTGGISVGERIQRLEEEVEAEGQARQLSTKEIWKEMTEMKLEMTRTQMKLMIVVTVLTFLASLVANVVIKKTFEEPRPSATSQQ